MPVQALESYTVSALSEQNDVNSKRVPPLAVHHGGCSSGQLQQCEWDLQATTQMLWPKLKGSTVGRRNA